MISGVSRITEARMIDQPAYSLTLILWPRQGKFELAHCFSKTSSMIQSDQADLYITWPQYHRLIEALGVQIYEADWAFDQILCLARGGLRIGDILSRLFDRPLAILSASSYYGQDSRTRGSVRFSTTLTLSEPEIGDRILLVDDLVDSGETLLQTKDWLEEHYQIRPHNCRTAVIWYKACSRAIPDYYLDYLSHNPWIHQPFETYENNSLEVLVSRFQRYGSMLES